MVNLPNEAGGSSGAGASGQEGRQHVAVDVADIPRVGGRGGLVGDDVAQGHLVDPAPAAVRADDEPVGASLLGERALVPLVELADLHRAELVGRVEEADDAIADDPPLVPDPGAAL